MKLAIMQPYFFPYLGYFQLIHAVDAFVVYDDVNFIKGGWINRNYILTQGEKTRITLQLLGASPNLPINQIPVGENRGKLLKTLQQSYARAPFYPEVFPLLEEILGFEEPNLAVFLDFGLRRICDYLNLRPRWHLSSDLQKDNSLRGQDKVLAICKELGAERYVNVPGGRDLYDRASFEAAGIRLSFIEPGAIKYRQSGDEFMPYLSAIDVLMHNNQEQCQSLLEEYRLV
ncbi:WbqC family protein [Methylotuvimicrobium sp. KM2]|uniref:WbqC family protein n=1 Tax=Methylotuvimicrobium sp. KM2 TaxID=3133976 RepID=UPI0031012B88